MARARSVLLALLLTAGSLSPPPIWGQTTRAPPPAEAERGFRLEQNYPNPVDPETWIPFVLEESLFASGDTGTVSLRIYNMLRQLVAVPIAVDHPRGRRVPVEDLEYDTPGRKVAYWDGRDTRGRRAPSGVYFVRLDVNGETQIRRLLVVEERRRPWWIPRIPGRQ
jgi:hypothetical protein